MLLFARELKEGDSIRQGVDWPWQRIVNVSRPTGNTVRIELANGDRVGATLIWCFSAKRRAS